MRWTHPADQLSRPGVTIPPGHQRAKGAQASSGSTGRQPWLLAWDCRLPKGPKETCFRPELRCALIPPCPGSEQPAARAQLGVGTNSNFCCSSGHVNGIHFLGTRRLGLNFKTLSQRPNQRQVACEWGRAVVSLGQLADMANSACLSPCAQTSPEVRRDFPSVFPVPAAQPALTPALQTSVR